MRATQIFTLILLLFALTAIAPADEYERQDALGLEVRVPLAPTWIPARDGHHALYELMLANLRGRALLLERLEIVDGDSGAVLESLQGEALRAVVGRRGWDGPEDEFLVLRGGQHGQVFLELRASASAARTSSLVHRLYLSAAGQPDGKTPARRWMLETQPVRFEDSMPTLGPPLKGDGWLAGNGLANDSDHRRALLPVKGVAGIAQRYAIDWVRVGANGLLTRDDPKLNASYFGYGEPVLAVADGRIAAVRDGIPENEPFSPQMAVPVTLDTAAGNYVMLETGGRYVLYAHLRPGSIRVTPGSAIRRGTPLGEVGNSGQSDAPHLHLHVSDTPTSLAGQGLPFVFESFGYRGTLDNMDEWLESGEPLSGLRNAAEIRTNELPLDGDVVDFPP
jgi:hypothetical protein